jgi:hypothetical protein
MLVTALFLVALSCSKAEHRRVTYLPAGTVELHQPISVAGATELRGARQGTTVHMAADFRGAAAIVIRGNNVLLHDFSIDGNRSVLEVRQGLPPYDRSFAAFTSNNGILADSREAVEIDDVRLRNIAGFAILANRVAHMDVNRVTVEDSGSRNAAGRNNANGGILFEEGSTDFSVESCTFRNILGNALWTHSLYTSPRNQRGVFAHNRIETVGRDALQVGHAKDMTIADNTASRIGFPLDASDLEARAIPVGIDTAGNVENAAYLRNRIAEINGKCMDLDGLHDSEIRGNVCVNRDTPAAYPLGNYAIVMNNTNPDMRTRNIRIVENRIERPVFGAIFVIGERNLIAHNLLLDLNTAHCNQNIARYQCNYAAADPHILEAGVYLGRGAERPAPARNNIVEYNLITGWGMKTGCVVSAPDIPLNWNTVRGNDCR